MLSMAAAVIFTGCDKEPEKVEPTLSINPEKTTISFATLEPVVESFDVDTNQESWDVVVTPATATWVKAAKKADGSGFTVTAEENLEPGAREEATITITAGEATPIVIKANQLGLDPAFTITPAPETLEFTAGATQSYTYEINTNQQDWDVTASEDWVVIEKDTDANTFTVTATLNGETTARTATLTATSGHADDIAFDAAQKEMEIFAIGHAYTTTSTVGGSDIVYWKNGVKTTMTTGGNYSVSKMFVYGDKVYATGQWVGAGARQALYFKPDGTYEDMTGTIGSVFNSGGTGIWVEGDIDNPDVYISYYEGPKTWYEGDLTTTVMAMVWKNGDVTEISEHLGSAQTATMWKDGDDIYIAGQMDGMRGYWKNGDFDNEADPAFYYSSTSGKFGSITDIKVMNGKVYQGGYTYDWDNSLYEGFWWADGEKHRFTNPNNDAIYCIDVDKDGNVYLGGNQESGWQRKASVVKNGQVTLLISEANMNAVTCGMKVWGDDVYVLTSSFAAPSQSSSSIGRLYKVDAAGTVELLQEFTGTEGTAGLWMADLWIQ